jgi:hypothetical protein
MTITALVRQNRRGGESVAPDVCHGSADRQSGGRLADCARLVRSSIRNRGPTAAPARRLRQNAKSVPAGAIALIRIDIPAQIGVRRAFSATSRPSTLINIKKKP